MTLPAFLNLTLRQQSEHLYRSGHLLAVRTDHEDYLFLYRVDTFYAELVFHRHTAKITAIRGFRAKSRLVRYSDSGDTHL